MKKIIFGFGLLIATTAYAATMFVPADVLKMNRQGSAPSSPGSGYVYNYFLDSDGFPYFKNSGGTINGYLYSSSALTNHGVLLGNGTRAPSVMSVCSNNTLFVGNTGADPSCRTLVNADVNASAAIDYSKLNLSGGIVNADVNASAAINPSKFATQLNGTVLANVSGSTASPSATTLSSVMDTAFGSTRGSIVYRGASGWTLLTPGTSGHFLKSQGSGADPIWAATTAGNTLSYIRLYDTDNDSNFGSTDTTVFEMSGSAVTLESGGSGITYANNSTNGATFTIGSGQTWCTMTVVGWRADTATMMVAVSKNADATTRSTNFDSLSTTKHQFLPSLGMSPSGGGFGTWTSASWSGACTSGDVFRAIGHTSQDYDYVIITVTAI